MGSPRGGKSPAKRCDVKWRRRPSVRVTIARRRPTAPRPTRAPAAAVGTLRRRLSSGSAVEQAEDGRAAARHRRVDTRASTPQARAMIAAISRMPRGDGRLQIVAWSHPRLACRPARTRLASPPVASLHPTSREGVHRAHAEVAAARAPPMRRRVAERKQTIAALDAEVRATLEKERHVGAERRGQQAQARASFTPTTARTRAARRPRRCCRRPAPPAAESASRAARATPLRLTSPAACAPHLLGGLPDQVAAIDRTRRIVAPRSENGVRRRAREREQVVERERLKRRSEIVVTVGPHTKHAQRQIDLRERLRATGAFFQQRSAATGHCGVAAKGASARSPSSSSVDRHGGRRDLDAKRVGVERMR